MMRDYHFSLGDSNSGAVGFCVVVQARSREQALSILKNNLPETIESPVFFRDTRILHFNVYLNPQNIKIQDIDQIMKIENLKEA